MSRNHRFNGVTAIFWTKILRDLFQQSRYRFILFKFILDILKAEKYYVTMHVIFVLYIDHAQYYNIISPTPALMDGWVNSIIQFVHLSGVVRYIMIMAISSLRCTTLSPFVQISIQFSTFCDDNSSPVQARTTRFGPKVQRFLLILGLIGLDLQFHFQFLNPFLYQTYLCCFVNI